MKSPVLLDDLVITLLFVSCQTQGRSSQNKNQCPSRNPENGKASKPSYVVLVVMHAFHPTLASDFAPSDSSLSPYQLFVVGSYSLCLCSLPSLCDVATLEEGGWTGVHETTERAWNSKGQATGADWSECGTWCGFVFLLIQVSVGSFSAVRHNMLVLITLPNIS